MESDGTVYAEWTELVGQPPPADGGGGGLQSSASVDNQATMTSAATKAATVGVAELQLSDLVRDLRLEAGDASQGQAIVVVHTRYVSNVETGERRTRVEERWERCQKLGHGAFGSVWLQRCVSGPAAGKLRAVKEIQKASATSDASSLHRELEAIARFSQERVSWGRS